MKRVVVTGMLAAMWATAGSGQDPLAQLGITPLAARVAVNTVLSSGLNNPGLPAAAFKLLTPAARGQVATAGMAWLKSYVASPEFATPVRAGPRRPQATSAAIHRHARGRGQEG